MNGWYGRILLIGGKRVEVQRVLGFYCRVSGLLELFFYEQETGAAIQRIPSLHCSSFILILFYLKSEFLSPAGYRPRLSVSFQGTAIENNNPSGISEQKQHTLLLN